MTTMTDAEQRLRDMAQFFRSGNEFDPANCCFASAACRVSRGLPSHGWMPTPLWELIGGDIDEDSLIANGWTVGCTDDAAAACEIAADLAS